MSRLLSLVLLSTTAVLAQTSSTQKHHPTFATDGNWVNQQQALENRARQILNTELSRKLSPACDVGKLSDAAFGNCFAVDAAATERNYRAFAQALKASLAIPHPNFDPELYPAAKNFAAGEVGWRTYVEKTCNSLADTDYSGTGTGMDLMTCQRNLTRQHMKDLSDVFLTRRATQP